MPRVTGLRSPHARVGRIVHFGRMLDKIRLEAQGRLPEEYRASLGSGKPSFFDGRCCRFLGIAYGELRDRTLKGGCDEELLAWAESRGTPRCDEECVVWNRFMTKLGWRDDRSGSLWEKSSALGLGKGAAETLFEMVDLDEGRPAGASRSWEAPYLSSIIVMGVSGCGKTTIGSGLAEALGWEFLEADSLHPPGNIAKMSAGIALDDVDRTPWLAAVRSGIEARVAAGKRVVAACSALKARYREALAPDPASCRLIHLHGDFGLISDRIGRRSGHFMKESLLGSQFETLEGPSEALAIDASEAPDVIINRIRKTLGLQ